MRIQNSQVHATRNLAATPSSNRTAATWKMQEKAHTVLLQSKRTQIKGNNAAEAGKWESEFRIWRNRMIKAFTSLHANKCVNLCVRLKCARRPIYVQTYVAMMHAYHCELWRIRLRRARVYFWMNQILFSMTTPNYKHLISHDLWQVRFSASYANWFIR